MPDNFKNKSIMAEGEGVPPEKLGRGGRGVQPTSQNPCSIFDQNLRYS